MLLRAVLTAIVLGIVAASQPTTLGNSTLPAFKGAVHLESSFLTKYGVAISKTVAEIVQEQFTGNGMNSKQTGDEGCGNFIFYEGVSAPSPPTITSVKFLPNGNGLTITADILLTAQINTMQSHLRSSGCDWGFGGGCGLVKKSVCNHNGHCSNDGVLHMSSSASITLSGTGSPLNYKLTGVTVNCQEPSMNFGGCNSFCSSFGSWCTSTVTAQTQSDMGESNLYAGFTTAVNDLVDRVVTVTNVAQTLGSLTLLTNGLPASPSVTASLLEPGLKAAGMTSAPDIFTVMDMQATVPAVSGGQSVLCVLENTDACKMQSTLQIQEVAVSFDQCAVCAVVVDGSSYTVWAVTTTLTSTN